MKKVYLPVVTHFTARARGSPSSPSSSSSGETARDHWEKREKRRIKKGGILASDNVAEYHGCWENLGWGRLPPPSIERLGWEWPPFSWRPVGIRMAARGSSTLRAEAARLVIIVIVYVLWVLGRW